jgi:hypothetical protein
MFNVVYHLIYDSNDHGPLIWVGEWDVGKIPCIGFGAKIMTESSVRCFKVGHMVLFWPLSSPCLLWPCARTTTLCLCACSIVSTPRTSYCSWPCTGLSRCLAAPSLLPSYAVALVVPPMLHLLYCPCTATLCAAVAIGTDQSPPRPFFGPLDQVSLSPFHKSIGANRSLSL